MNRNPYQPKKILTTKQKQMTNQHFNTVSETSHPFKQADGNSSAIVHSCRFRMDMELCPEPLSLTSRLEVAPISVP